MLRPGLPIDTCVFEGDQDDQTFHLGAFVEGKLVSIASFYFERHPDLDELYQFRLRGMATLQEHQNKGLSASLLNRGFPIIRQNQCNLVWCFARETAIGFYEKNGFKGSGEIFEIEGVGPHLLMINQLSE